MELRSLGEIYLASAAKHADSPALSVAGEVYTYGELLQHALRLKLPPLPANSLCAVWAERDLSAYIGVLGTVLRGHAFLALSPGSPPVRNAEIIRQSGAGVLITNSEHWAQVAQLRVLLPPDFEIVNTDDLQNPTTPRLGLPNESAYMMFTSGSTGSPRGVEIQNSQVMSYLRNAQSLAPVTEADRVSQMFDLNFDLSVHDMFMCWGGGACLFVPSNSERSAPHEFINRHFLTYWFSVPSVISLIGSYGALNPGSFPSLRTSLFCGEALRLNQAEAWRNAAPRSKVVNLYGPTEGTIAISHYVFDERHCAQVNGIVSIGQIFPGHGYRIVNDELFLQGLQIIKKYVGEKPYAGAWYKTGDLVREENGNLFFLGRSDTQIKLRGLRVELNEIAFIVSSVLKGSPAVALAWPSNDAPENIYVFVESKDVNEEDLLAECSRRLPPYMIPTAIFALEKFPLNERGKTDRLKLATELAKLVK
jgi:non-ribosomal peptide synthetase component F